MLPLFEVTGFIFWAFVAICFLWEGCALYNESHGWAISVAILLIIFYVVTCGTAPITTHWKWLLVWPIGSILWLPTFWYVSLKRRAAKIKAYVKKHGPINGDTQGLMGLERRLNFRWLNVDNKIRIDHPDSEELTANAIAFPISAPIFIFDTWIQAAIEALKNKMNYMRDRISAAANI